MLILVYKNNCKYMIICYILMKDDALVCFLKSSLSRDNIIDDVKRRRYFEKPFQKRRRLEYEEMRSIYNKEMARRIQFLMRKNREEPWPL
ncbi:putative 28S ribosomal protein S21, mitochondrial [Apostichopus japonicus]|uniref:Putative 28S ribosomal protein S21, mitochondrial n=1 Tax=Stichopus japonicus TaxID=307972 RepID=A0A2G8K2D2_STIJA|nr:putative 28S ribosomal protein S21, mitochondrial [Apostichopus japonicus]